MTWSRYAKHVKVCRRRLWNSKYNRELFAYTGRFVRENRAFWKGGNRRARSSARPVTWNYRVEIGQNWGWNAKLLVCRIDVAVCVFYKKKWFLKYLTEISCLRNIIRSTKSVQTVFTDFDQFLFDQLTAVHQQRFLNCATKKLSEGIENTALALWK
jgi:hypothetical protein